jgi:thiol-disulfide isomerase/thioredoxin
MRRLAVLGVMVAVAGLVVWAGVFHWQARSAARAKAKQSEVTLVNADSLDAGFGSDLRHKPAPAFTLKDTNGKKVSLSDFKGHPVVVNFWATDCGWCMVEMPWFEEFSKKYAGQGLVVLGLDEEDNLNKAERIQHVLKKTGVTYPVLVADDVVAKSFGLGDYLPVTYYVDKDGIVAEQVPGAGSKDEIEAHIRKIAGAE